MLTVCHALLTPTNGTAFHYIQLPLPTISPSFPHHHFVEVGLNFAPFLATVNLGPGY
jgi:hypothetical protein